MVQSATQEVKEAFRSSPIKTKLKVLIDWIAKGDTPGTITADEWDSTYLGKDKVYDGELSARYRPFIFGDSMTLGSEIKFLSNKYSFGWHSLNRSDSNGEFSSAEVISMIFDDVHTANYLTVTSSEHNYLVDFDLYYRDETDTSWELCESFSGVSTYITTYSFTSETNIKGWKIEITKILLPDTPAVVIEVQSGFQEDVTKDVISFEIQKELEWDSGSLPYGNISANSLDLKLRNDHKKYNPFNRFSEVYNYLKSNRVIRPYIGIDIGTEIVFFPQGVYYMRTLDTNPDMTVDIFAVDRMAFLGDEEFVSSELYEDKKISELVQIIVEDAGLVSSEYSIDDTVNIIPFAWFEPRRHVEDLKRLAIAEAGVANFDELGILQFKKRGWAGTESEATFTDKDIVKDSAVSPYAASNMKNYITIVSKPLELQSDTEIFTSSETITIGAGESLSLACYYSTVPCKSVGNAVITKDAEITLDSESKYAWATYLVFTNTAGVDKTITSITINGSPLTNEGSRNIVSKDDDLISMYGKSEYKIESEFIQSIPYAKDLADHLLSANKEPMPIVQFQALGLPYLQLGDLISVRITKIDLGEDLF